MFRCLVSAFLLVLVSWTAAAEEKKPPKVTFEDDVKPILRQRCFACHNPDKKSGDLDLTNYSGLMQGGGSGEVISAGDSGSSYLYLLITHQSEPYMPPESPKLPDQELETIRKWIEGGVLETQASAAKVVKKKTFDLALQTVPTERPAVVPLPPRLSLEPAVRTPGTSAITALATSPWAPLAAVAGQHQVLLYNTQTLELVGVFPFPEGLPHVLKFSRNGALLLAAGGQEGAAGKAVVWNILTGERIFEVGDELDAVLAADISSDQTLVALGGPQKVVRIYATETGQLLHELHKHTDWIYSLEFSPDSVLLASGDRNGGLMVWEGWTGREYLTLNGHTGGVKGVSWRADSNVLASCSEDGTIRLWEMENGGQIRNWGAHGGGAAAIEFTRDGRILSCGRDRVTKLWDQNGGQLAAFEPLSDLALEATFCDETNRAIAGDWNGSVILWNAADGARLGELSPNPPTLAERLDAANQALAARRAEYEPLAAALASAQSEADKLKGDLTSAAQAAEKAQKQSEDAAAKLTAAKEAVAVATGTYEAAVKEQNALATGVPSLMDAATKAQEAAAKLTDDKELAELAAKLKAAVAQRTQQLETSKKAASDAAANLESAKEGVTVAEKAAQDAEVGYKAAMELVTRLTPQVQAADEKLTVAKQAADAAGSALAAAQSEAQRWADEIAFNQQLNELLQQHTQALQLYQERALQAAELTEAAAVIEAEVNKAKAALTAAEEVLAASQAQLDGVAAELKQAQEAAVEAKAAEEEASKLAKALAAVIGPLEDAVAKAKLAAEKAGNDPELVDAASKLQGITDGKKAALGAAQQDLEAKAKTATIAREQVKTTEKRFAEAKAALEAAQQRTTELTQALQPLLEKAAAAQIVASQAAQQESDSQAAADALRAQLLHVRGVQAP